MNQQTKTPNMLSFYYLQVRGFYRLADMPFLAESVRTIDVRAYDLATNYNALAMLGIDVPVDSRERAFELFIEKLMQSGVGREKLHRKQKLETNPFLRLLVEDEKLLADLKKVIKPYKNKTHQLA